MIAVVLEPALLAVPPVAESEEEVEAIIDRLSAWSSCVMSGGVLRIAQMSDTTDILGQINCWPTGPNVEALLDMYGLKQVYSAAEVSRLINTILERAYIVQDEIGIEVAECNPSGGRAVSVYPVEELLHAGNNAFATVASGLSSAAVFLAPASGNLGSPYLQFKAQVEAVTTSEVSHDVQAPFSVFGRVDLALGPNCVCDILVADRVWQNATTSEQIHFAILLKIREILKTSGQDARMDTLPSFIVGSDFMASLHANQASGTSKYSSNVLESCARAILRHPKNAIDPFMNGARSKSSEQRSRSRDGHLAYRTHVSKKGEGLRLMLWSTSPLGTIELANVAVHDELIICDGDRAAAVESSWYSAGSGP